MAIRQIRIDDDPVLRKKARPVENFDDKLKVLVEDMIDTMYHAEGVGLAAPQIGILRQIFVVDVYDETGVKVLINPQMLAQEGSQTDPEGCLSLPGKSGKVTRPMNVKLRAQDLKGDFFEVEAEGFLARAFCHEFDHLQGILYIDKVEKGEVLEVGEEEC